MEAKNNGRIVIDSEKMNEIVIKDMTVTEKVSSLFGDFETVRNLLNLPKVWEMKGDFVIRWNMGKDRTDRDIISSMTIIPRSKMVETNAASTVSTVPIVPTILTGKKSKDTEPYAARMIKTGDFRKNKELILKFSDQIMKETNNNWFSANDAVNVISKYITLTESDKKRYANGITKFWDGIARALTGMAYSRMIQKDYTQRPHRYKFIPNAEIIKERMISDAKLNESTFR